VNLKAYRGTTIRNHFTTCLRECSRSSSDVNAKRHTISNSTKRTIVRLCTYNRLFIESETTLGARCAAPFYSTRKGRTVPRLAQIRPYSTYTKHQLTLLSQYNIRCTIGLVTVTLQMHSYLIKFCYCLHMQKTPTYHTVQTVIDDVLTSLNSGNEGGDYQTGSISIVFCKNRRISFGGY
jgi:hypothetical protein